MNANTLYIYSVRVTTQHDIVEIVDILAISDDECLTFVNHHYEPKHAAIIGRTPY